LFLAGVYLGLGVGGMERLAFDTLTVWTGVLGAAVLRCAVPGRTSAAGTCP